MFSMDEVIKLRHDFLDSYENNDFLKSVELGEQLVEEQKVHFSQMTKVLSDDLFNLGKVYAILNENDKALRAFLESSKIIAKVEKKKGLNFADRLVSLSVVHVRKKNLEMALRLQNEALKIRQSVLGEDNELVYDSIYNVANIHYEMGDFEKSLDLHIKITKNKNLPEEFVADSLTWIAYCYEKLEDSEKAVKAFKTALTRKKKLYAESSSEYIADMIYFAKFCDKYDLSEEAIGLFKKAAAVVKKTYSDTHPFYAGMLNHLADIQTASENYEDALKIRLKVLQLTKNSIGSEHLYYANTLRSTAKLYSLIGNAKKSIEAMREVLSIKKKIMGIHSLEYIRDVLFMCGVLVGENKLPEAIIMLNEILEGADINLNGSDDFKKVMGKVDKILKNFVDFTFNDLSSKGAISQDEIISQLMQALSAKKEKDE